MGATNFECRATGETVRDAFRDAVEAACWEHGHGGYTGTIAEKDGYVEFPVPEGITPDELVELIMQSWWHAADREQLVKLMGEAEAQRIMSTFDGKWGPAVALRASDNEWLFCGMASC